MPTTLQGLYATLIATRRDGSLALAAGSAGAPAIDHFLAALPGATLTVQRADIQLLDQHQPATLIVAGPTDGSWPLPSMSQTTVQPQAVTITYSQATPGAVVTATLAMTAALAIGPHTITLHGTLGPDGLLAFAWDATQGGTLSLAAAASVVSDGQPGTLLPPDLPLFSSLGLTAYTLSFGYLADAGTTMSFSLDASPSASWDIIGGQHALKKIGVTLTATYQPLAFGYRAAIGGNVHATLDLGREFEVAVGLAAQSFWQVDVVAVGGLPALESLAQLAGAGDTVTSGLRAIGLGDITLTSVSIAVSRDDGSLAFIAMEGSLSFLEKVIDVHVQLPHFQFGGALSERTPISLTSLLEGMLGSGSADGLPDIAITELTLAAAPSAGQYSLLVTMADNQITAGKYGLRQVNVMLNKDASGTTGGITGVIALGTAELMLFAGFLGPPDGWSFRGELSDLNIRQLLEELASTYGIDQVPEPVKTLELTKVTVSYQTGTGHFAFDLEADFRVQATPVRVEVTITVMPSAQAPADGAPSRAVTQGTQGYAATFTGQVKFAGLQFDIIFDVSGTGTDVLVADFVHAGEPVELRALVASVSADAAALIPAGISVDLSEIKFVFLKQAARQWAFGLRLGIGFSLSDLPVVGSRLPRDLALAVENLQVLYSSAALDPARVAIINPLLPPGVTTLPVAVGKGIAFDADIRLGTSVKHLHAGVTPPPATAPAARAALPASPAAPQGAVAPAPGAAVAPVLTGTVVPAAAAGAPASSTDPVTWVDINRQFGIFSFERVGVGYQDNALRFALDASVAVGPVAFSMQALTVGSSLSEFKPTFSLQGLALSFDRPPLSVGGAFLKVEDSYYGQLIVQAATFSLKALGGWSPDADPASFFLYLSISVPLGGPPFLFVTGLAGGFGVNSRLVLPPIDKVGGYPLLPGKAPAEKGTPAETIKEVVPLLAETFVVMAGQYWVAAGISFTSFEMIEARAVISVTFGVDLQIGVVGTCAMTFPTGDLYPVAYIEIDVVASFTPSTGLLSVDGKLSPASYLFGGFVKLTGGFAFYAWFSGERQGDFVVSIGGYHPAFVNDGGYPVVPRLGLEFSLGPLKVVGQAYFALTPGMFMAGVRLSATFEVESIKAWFDAGVDFLIAWAPFHYEAHAWVAIGCAVDLGLFTLNVQIGADLELWGPAFGGEAVVDLDVASFTIAFGAPRTAPAPVGWSTFATNFLPSPQAPPIAAEAIAARQAARAAGAAFAAAAEQAAPEPVPNIVKATITAGMSSQAPGVDWILDPDHFRILTASTIPANHGLWSTSATDTAELPNVVSSYQRAAAPVTDLAAARPPATIAPPPQMLLRLDHAAVTYSSAQVWAPVLNIAPMSLANVASYHTVTLRKRDEQGQYTGYVTGVTVAPQLGASNAALWGATGQVSDPNAPRLIPSTLTGLAISPVPRHPAQVSDLPLQALILAGGISTGFSYQAPVVDQRFTVTSAVSDHDETLTITVGGEGTQTLDNHQHMLSALARPWVASQRSATLDELRRLGFSTRPGDASRLDLMARTALTDWPSAALIGSETWA